MDQNTANTLNSPTPSAASMALLSPPASRYAFEPGVTTQSIPPINSVLSPVPNVLSPFAGTPNPNQVSSPRLGNNLYPPSENDIPAFEPKTEIILENFTHDLKTFTNWIKNLNIEEQKTTMDIFLQSLNPEVLQYLKSKINNLEIKPASDSRDGETASLVFSPAASVSKLYQSQIRPVSPLLALNNEPTTLDQFLNDQGGATSANNNIPHSPYIGAPSMPVIPPSARFAFTDLMEPISRPRSAGPFYNDIGFGFSTPPPPPGVSGLSSAGGGGLAGGNSNSFLNQPQAIQLTSQPLIRALSAEFDGSTSNIGQMNSGTGNGNGNGDFAGQNAIKLNHSLSTITSRFRLDNGKKLEGGQQPQGGQNQLQLQQGDQQQGQFERGRHAGRLHQLNGRQFNNQSTSLPPSSRPSHYHNNNNYNSSSNNSSSNNTSKLSNETSSSSASSGAKIFTPVPTKNQFNQSGVKLLHSGSSSSLHQIALQANNTGGSKSPMPKDISSKKLLNDIPAWLKALRLHKYTENLKNLKWQDMIELNDSQLCDLGVGTVGARNKLLKSFTFVKENLHE
ncbi:unnamed protein product [Ambrosiozyma monospora]|uniref:Unnamed protein product n=1 Tax=Ambrosiozyma monospora TaxID=43982 RepID=A0A9W6YS38_AMBMO|nr:unnamed protein product [Ambrosiozyma monospora]